MSLDLVVTLARDVGIDLFLVGETYTGNLSHSRIRFLGSGCIHTYANTTSLRTCIERARFALDFNNLATFTN